MLVILLTMYFSATQPEARVIPGSLQDCETAALIALRSAGPDRVDWARCVQVSVPARRNGR